MSAAFNHIKYFSAQTAVLLFVLFSISSCAVFSKKNSATITEQKKESRLNDKQKIEFQRLFFDASKEKILGNYDMAETLFAQALSIDPSSAAVMYELGGIYTFQNKKSQALHYSKRAAQIEPSNEWYQLLYSEALKENKQYEAVTKVFEQLVKDHPERIDFYYELSNAYLLNSKIPEALKTYDNLEARFGVTEDASMQKIKIYRIQKKYDKAIEVAKNLIRAYPNESKYYSILGDLYQDMGQSEKALDAYNDLLKIDPNNAYVHLSLADYYRSVKQNEKAFEEIKISFQSKELDIDTKIKILLSYYAITENYPELKPDADELCKILVDIHQDDAKSYSMYGDFLYRDKKLEEARTQFRKSIALDKERFALWNQLVIINSELNDYEALAKEGQQAIDLFPNQPVFYYLSAIGNIQLKNYTTAIKQLEDGKEFVFDNNALLAQFYASLGDVYHYVKDHERSDNAYEKCLKLEPDNAFVLNNFAYYLSVRKVNLEKAEAMSKKSNELEPNNNSFQDTYGWILFQTGKYEEAKKWINKAIENGGKNNGTLLEHYGDVLFKLNNTEEALDYWKRAKAAGGASDKLDKKIADKKLHE